MMDPDLTYLPTKRFGIAEEATLNLEEPLLMTARALRSRRLSNQFSNSSVCKTENMLSVISDSHRTGN